MNTITNSVNNSDITLTLNQFVILNSTTILFPISTTNRLFIAVNFSHNATGLITANYNLAVNGGLVNDTPNGIGIFTSSTVNGSTSFNYLLSGFSTGDVNVALAIKVQSGALYLKATDPPLIISVSEV